jgi:Type II CAAX prenyl endopeptidase Rce1-like
MVMRFWESFDLYKIESKLMNKRQCIAIALLGLLGVASLGIAPLEALLPPSVNNVPRLALLIQPLVLVLIMSALGCWAAPKLGLGAPILGLSPKNPTRALLSPIIISIVAVASILIAYSWFSRNIALAVTDPNIQRIANFQVPLVTKLLYGGISEEVICRWGLMSAFGLLAIKLGAAREKALWIGNSAAALLFALGHLPLLFAIMPDPPFLFPLLIVAGNMIPGLIFGALFARFGIEAAMIAHGGAHLLSTAVIAVMH